MNPEADYKCDQCGDVVTLALHLAPIPESFHRWHEDDCTGVYQRVWVAPGIGGGGPGDSPPRTSV